MPSCALFRPAGPTDPIWHNEAFNDLSPAQKDALRHSKSLLAAIESNAEARLTIQLETALAEILCQPLPDGVLVTILSTSASPLLSPTIASARGRAPRRTFEDRLRELGGNGERILSFDWRGSSIGAPATWSPAIWTVTLHCMATTSACCVWVGDGEDPTQVHNSIYGQLVGERFGKRISETWAENWPKLRELYACVRRSETYIMRGDCWIIDGVARYFNAELTAVYDPHDGSFVGALNIATEVTAQIISQRRLEALQIIANRTSSAQTMTTYCAALMSAIAECKAEVPFAMLYTITRPTSQRLTSNRGHARFTLQGSAGVPLAHPLAPSVIVLRGSQTGSETNSMADTVVHSLSEAALDDEAPWPMAEVLKTGKPTIVEAVDGRFEGLGGLKGSEAVRRVAVIPLAAQESAAQAVLVVALPITRRFDADYECWLFGMVSEHVGASLAKINNSEMSEMHTRQLHELEVAKGAFFEKIGSELETPISLILGPLEDALADSALSAPSRHAVRTANKGALRLMSLTTTFLDFFRLQAGRFLPVFRPTQLADLVGDLASSFAAAVRGGGVQITVDTRPVTVYVDSEIIEKVVLGALGTLLRTKHWQNGSIAVTLRDDAQTVILSIISSAPKQSRPRSMGKPSRQAMPSSFDEHTAEPFASTSFDRLGLNRSVLEDLVKLLKANLREERTPDQHAFFITFTTLNRQLLQGEHVVEEPINAASAHPASRYTYAVAAIEDGSLTASDESDADSTSGTSASAIRLGSDDMYSEQTRSIQGSLVLLAVPDADLRAYCKSALNPTFRIIEATTTSEANIAAHSEEPDLIIADANLPNADGLAFLSQLRQSARQLPIIVLSAQIAADTRIDGLLANPEEHLSKPFSARELVVKACSQVQLAKMRNEIERKYIERTTALAESEARARDLATEYQALVDLSTVGLFKLNEQGAVEHLNSKWDIA